MPGEPSEHLGVFMNGVVVENDVDELARGYPSLNRIEEADELLVPVLLHATAEHGALEHVESGEERGRAVTLVVMGHGPTFAGLERQAGLGAVERLDLGFLVDREHDRMGGRAHVEADNIGDLLSQGGIAGALEGCRRCGCRRSASQMRWTAPRCRADTARAGAHRGSSSGAPSAAGS